MNKDNDYGVFLAIITICIMIGVFAQCESASNIDSIRQELGNIRRELNIIR